MAPHISIVNLPNCLVSL